jgi:glycosyltransferase involved in cell wall biosynthesis
MKRKIIWVAPYPVELAMNDVKNKPVHSAPWITALADGLKDQTDLTIISTSSKINESVSFDNNGIHFHFIKIPHPLMEFFIFFRGEYIFLKQFSKCKDFKNYDLIHFHGTEHQYASAFKHVKIPKVISIQGLMFKYLKYNKQFNYNLFSWRFLKSFEKEEIKKNKNFICRTWWDTSNIKSLNHEAAIFENWEILRPEFYTDAFNYNSYNIVFIGGLSAMKGIREVLLMFKELTQQNSLFTLTLCGSSDYKLFEKLVEKYQLKPILPRIFFKNRLNASELVDLYKSSFCLVHPTYIDNSPNSVCEAQVAGLPVIASNVGGVSTLIKDSSTGLLVERYQTMEIVEAILRLKREPVLYQSISLNCRNECRVRHNSEIIIKKTLDIYETIIQNNENDIAQN